MRKDFGSKTFLYPQPVMIIGTYDENGLPNAMNAAWGGICDYDKIMIAMSDHKTTDNIAITKAFSVSPAVAEQVFACDYVGVVSGKNEPNKIEKSGLTVEKCAHINAPLFSELPLTLECTLDEIIGDGMYIGKIVNVCVDDSVLADDGMPDMEKFRPILYDPARHNYNAIGEIVGKAFSDGKKIK